MANNTDTTDVSDAEKAAVYNAARLNFYKTIDVDIPESGRKLLEGYSKIPPDQVYDHADAIRNKAFDIWHYPCIGMFRFLDLGLRSTDEYQEVLERLKNGEVFLDLGTCFGQEIRQLVYDGVPSDNLYGSDLRKDYMDIGYDLFGDKGTLKTKFIAADVFDDNSAVVQQLAGKVNIVYTGAFFHLFDYDDQVKIAKRVVQLLKPEKGSLILGRQMGNKEGGVFARPGYQGETQRYRHSDKTWKEMWEKVGEITKSKWEVHAALRELEATAEVEKKLSSIRREPGARRLTFSVRRVD